MKYGGYWEMRKGGPDDAKKGGGREIFKCTCCGAETEPEKGWDGEPDAGRCASWCRNKDGDWRPGRVSDAYRRNFDRIFPGAPGAGI